MQFRIVALLKAINRVHFHKSVYQIIDQHQWLSELMKGQQSKASMNNSNDSVTLNSRPSSQLIQCIDTMAINLETAFRQMASAMEIFRTQIAHIKGEGVDRFSPYIQRGQMSKGKLNQRPINDVVSGPAGRQKKQSKQTTTKGNSSISAKLEYTPMDISQTLDFTEEELECLEPTMLMEEGQCDVIREQKPTGSVSWEQFLQSQRMKMATKFPLAQAEQVDTFIRDKWDDMSESEKRKCVLAQRRKREEDAIRLLKRAKGSVREEKSVEVYHDRFQNLLNKKNKREQQLEKGERRQRQRLEGRNGMEGMDYPGKRMITSPAAVEEKLKRIFQ